MFLGKVKTSVDIFLFIAVDDPKKYVVFCGLRSHAELKGRLVNFFLFALLSCGY